LQKLPLSCEKRVFQNQSLYRSYLKRLQYYPQYPLEIYEKSMPDLVITENMVSEDGGEVLLFRAIFTPEHVREASKKYGCECTRPYGNRDAIGDDFHTEKKAEKLCGCDERKNQYGDSCKRFHA
jgi:hypothetical protein